MAHPTSSRRLASKVIRIDVRSTVKPSLTSCSAASRVPKGSGSRWRLSWRHFQPTKVLFSWPRERRSSRPNRATRTASSAVAQPAYWAASRSVTSRDCSIRPACPAATPSALCDRHGHHLAVGTLQALLHHRQIRTFPRAGEQPVVELAATDHYVGAGRGRMHEKEWRDWLGTGSENGRAPLRALPCAHHPFSSRLSPWT